MIAGNKQTSCYIQVITGLNSVQLYGKDVKFMCCNRLVKHKYLSIKIPLSQGNILHEWMINKN